MMDTPRSEWSDDARLANALCVVWIAVFTLRLAFQAAEKPFWHDEIFSLSISGMGPTARAWSAMTSGYEFNPPGIYLVIWLSETVFGRGKLSSRLPSLLAGVVAFIALFRYHSISGHAWRGLWTVSLFSLTGASEYWFDARPYAFLLAGAACWMVGWKERAVMEMSGRGPLLWMLGGLWMATLFHAWSLALIATFGLVELWRWWSTRCVDWRVLGVFVLGMIPTSIYPWIASFHGAQVQLEGTYRHSLLGSYLQIFGLALWGYLLILGLIAAFDLMNVSRDRMVDSLRSVSFTEWLLYALLLLLPVQLYVVTDLMQSQYMGRYGIGASLGIAFVLATIVDAVTQARGYRMLGFGILSLLAVVLSSDWDGRPGKQNEVDFRTVDLESLAGDEVIVISSGMHFMSFFHYASPDIRSRLRKVADRDMAVQYLRTDKEDSPLIRGAEYLGIASNLIDYDEFKELTHPFVFIDYPGWLQQTPEMKGARITAIDDAGVLYRVELNVDSL